MPMNATRANAAHPSPPAYDSADCTDAFLACLARVEPHETPYRHWIIDRVFPPDVADALADLPFQPPALDGVSGKRELHNDQRSYFDADGMRRFPVMRAVAEALQGREATQAIAKTFGAPIDDTFLRLEYALDVDGFWLEPHTDLGVKKFTCLIYLPEGPGQESLGTDIYASKTEHHGTSPFRRNTAMVFVPGADTWHGFEKRPIEGVRKSVILNYVTHDWRAREQLSFPETPVRL